VIAINPNYTTEAVMPLSELRTIVYDFLQLASMYKSIRTFVKITSGEVRI